MAERLCLRLAGLALMAGASPALAEPREAWQAPTLTITRYDEDWSKLADPANRTGRWTETVKYIPLDARGDSWIGTGVEVRLRSENYRNNLWGAAPAPDDGYLWARTLPYVDLHVGQARAFVQPIVAYAVGVAPSAGPIDQTRTDLLQAFAEVDVPIGDAVSVTLRGGRQMLSLGTERLIGTRYGPNVPLAFDGVRANVRTGNLALSLFSVRPVQPRLGSFDDRTSQTRALWGVYAALPGIDAYYLAYRNREASFGGVTGREQRHSIGLRSYGTAGDWGWNVEGVVQVGTFADRKIRAWTLASEVSHTFPTMPLAPRAMMRLNVISGDRNAQDRTLGTFNALFPKGKYFGELSPVGPYNVVNLLANTTFDLGRSVTLGVSGMAYWRYTRGDGIYDVPGNLVRAPGTATSRMIGREIEATLSWQATPELELSTSFSAFAAGDFLRQTGSAKTIGMIGLEANYRI